MSRYSEVSAHFLFLAMLTRISGKRGTKMIIKMRYEDKFQELEVDAVDAGKWVNISIDDCESQEEFEKQVQEQVDKQFNKPEYNIYHRETRHLGDAMFRNKDGVVEVNTDEALIRKVADDSIFTKDLDELEYRMEREYQDKRCCDFIRSHLTSAQADMVIAIALDGKTAREIAAENFNQEEMTDAEFETFITKEANKISKKYNRALKKLKKCF